MGSVQLHRQRTSVFISESDYTIDKHNVHHWYRSRQHPITQQNIEAAPEGNHCIIYCRRLCSSMDNNNALLTRGRISFSLPRCTSDSDLFSLKDWISFSELSPIPRPYVVRLLTFLALSSDDFVPSQLMLPSWGHRRAIKDRMPCCVCSQHPTSPEKAFNCPRIRAKTSVR